MKRYIDELNDPQREAVMHPQGPLMIIAGAGSGKTRVLTYRIAWLIEQGVDPFQILSLTFTNKAAGEMRQRIEKIIGNEAKNLWMGTFHSVFAKILRIEGQRLGYNSDFSIYDSDDSKSLIRSIIKEFALDDKVYKPNFILNRISGAKNGLISWEAYQSNPQFMEDDKAAKMPEIGRIYKTYQLRCFQANAMDFDDLLLKTNELLTRFPEVLAKYQDRFRYILVDEYQDTNHSQYLIVKALASKFENICVVGDDAQSIYSFRGANIYNILNFKKDYPDAVTVSLEQNYRSTQNIVNAANVVIAKNLQQFKKNVFSENEEGEKIDDDKPGCEPGYDNGWNIGVYGEQVAPSETKKYNLNTSLVIRSMADPYITATTLTMGKFSFVETFTTKFILGIILLSLSLFLVFVCLLIAFASCIMFVFAKRVEKHHPYSDLVSDDTDKLFASSGEKQLFEDDVLEEY